MNFLLSHVLIFLVSLTCFKEPETEQYTHIVNSQEQFAAMLDDVRSGKCVSAYLGPGNYVIKGTVCPSAAWKMVGKNAVLSNIHEEYSTVDAIAETSDHYICKLKGAAVPYELFVGEDNEIIPVSESVDPDTKVNELTSGIIGDTQAGSSILIPLPSRLSYLKQKTFCQAYGYFDCGWGVVKVIVKGTDDNYLFCKSLNNAPTGKNNFERENYGKDIRMVLFNAEIKKGHIYYDSDKIYIPKGIKKVSVLKPMALSKTDRAIVTRSPLSLSGITFRNFTGIYVYNSASDLLEIKNCHFINCLESALTITRKHDAAGKTAIISDCSFLQCSLYDGNVVSLSSEGDASAIRYVFSNNIISRYTSGVLMYKNCTGAVSIKSDTEINGNIIYNVCRDHLYLNQGKILVKNNILFNSEKFNSYEKRNLSSDFGIIYCNHIYSNTEEAVKNTSNRIEIAENYIFGARRYGIMGVGIYIDDGRGDVSCTKNIVLDCQDASIDSRAVNSYIGSSSIRNVIESNILDTRYRLQSGEQVSATYAPIADDNYLLGDFENILDGVNQRDEDNECKGVKYFVTQSRLVVDKSSSNPELTQEYRSHKYVKFVSAANFDSIASKSSEK